MPLPVINGTDKFTSQQGNTLEVAKKLAAAMSKQGNKHMKRKAENDVKKKKS